MKKTTFIFLIGFMFCVAVRADGHRNVHYYSGASSVRWDLLTHLVYFDTSVIDSNGIFIAHTPAELADIARLQRQADEYGKILMVCYGGSFSFDGPFKDMLEDSIKRAAFIQAIADNVTNLNLAGVDLDWEYPSTEYEFSLMDTFYTEIRTAIGPKPLLSAAVAGWQPQLAAATVNSSLDWIQLMTYYWRTPAESAADLKKWTDTGVTKSKVHLGVPFAGKSKNATVKWDIPYLQFVNSIVPFDPDVNNVYYAPYEGDFNFTGVSQQKEKMRVAAEGGGGTMVWHHRTDVEDPDRSLAVSLHDEIVRHVAVIDSFELPVGESANHLYQAGDAAVTGTYTRVAGFTGAEVTLVFSGGPWSGGNLTSRAHPTGYAFPAGAQIRFDYKVLDTHPDVSMYLRLFDGEGNSIQQPVYNALTTAGWKRAAYNRGGFNTNTNFNENDVRQYKILAQIGNVTIPAFTSRVVFDNLCMIAPDPTRRPVEDRDADGYSDALETLMGTSAIDAADTPSTPLKGLRAWWKFDDNFSLLAREEIQQVHGKVYGASWVKGRSGYALQLNGIDDRIVMDSTAALAGTNDFSLCAWVKTTDTNGGMILQQRDGISTDGQYRLRCNSDGLVYFSIHNAGYQFNFPSTTAINDGNWHHVVATRAGANGFIYVDGELDGQASGPLKALSEHIVAAGYSHRENSDHLNGTLDDIRIYTRALGSDEIIQLFTDADSDALNDEWEIAQYGDSAAYGPMDNPDGDRFNMFAEMAFGGRALVSDASSDFIASSIAHSVSTTNLVFSYRRTKNHVPFRVTYQLQCCDTLESKNWIDHSAPVHSVTDDPDGTTEWATHLIPMLFEDDRQFFRVLAAPQ